jgi:CheY-like chemotaxis protein
VVCDVAASGMDALDVAESVKFDLIISGLHLPGMTGFELAESLRQSGYKGPLIAMSADESDTARVEALSRGFTSMLAKPYCFEDLLKLLTGYLKPQAGTGKNGGAGDVLLSALWGDQQMRPLIQRFVQRLEPQLREMRRLCDVQGAEPLLRKHYMDLKGSAGGYGFPTISKAAQHLLDLPEAGAHPDEVRKRREALDKLCMAAMRAVENASPSQQQAA